MRKPVLVAAGTVVVLAFLAAAVTAQAGLDYTVDGGDAIDALVRGDWRDFFANEPLMGGFSLWLRAPFVWPVFHSSVSTVYWVGSLPCVAALVALGIWLLRGMQRRGRSEAEQAMVGAALILSPLTVRALHWGHPEELLGAALCVAAVILSARGRVLLSGLALGGAIATKQWAVIAALPVLVAAPAPSRLRLVGATVAVAIALTAPMLAGNSDRFMLVQRAASSADPQYVIYGSGHSPFPGSHVTPNNVFLPFAHAYQAPNGTIFLQSATIGRLAHPLILVLAAALTLLVWRRRGGRLDAREALLLFAMLMLARCLLDPMTLDYYHVPFLAALGAAAALGGLREARLALFATAGLAIAYAVPTDSMYQLSEHAHAKNAVYLAVALPLLGALLAATARRSPVRHARVQVEPDLALSTTSFGQFGR